MPQYFFSDIQKQSIKLFLDNEFPHGKRVPYKVIDQDMLHYLKDEPDNLLCIIACGIEDCVLPGEDYRKKVEDEIFRTIQSDSFFISSHSDLFPSGLDFLEFSFARPANPKVYDRFRLHGAKNAFDKYQDQLKEVLASTKLINY